MSDYLSYNADQFIQIKLKILIRRHAEIAKLVQKINFTTIYHYNISKLTR